MNNEYFIFIADTDTFGGQSFTLITKEEVLEMYSNELNKDIPEDIIIQDFIANWFAKPLTREQYFLIQKFNNHFLQGQ